MCDSDINMIVEIQEGVKITLDCAQAAFIAGDKLVVSLRGGEL
jgi:cleavage and polyadenylation specificity factor subunit 1